MMDEMKRIQKCTGLLLSCVLVAGAMTGCGGSGNASSASETSEGAATNRESEVNQEAHQGEWDTSGGRYFI